MPIVVHKEDEPLLEAVMRGDMEEMKDILRGGDGDIFRDVNANGDTALHLACRFGRLDFVKYFLKSASSDRARAARNNRANVRGQIPLHYAAMVSLTVLLTIRCLSKSFW
jgi:ankyrin repeat protein